MRGFSGFDNKSPDMRPLKRRMEVLKEGLPLEGFTDDAQFRDESGELNKELLTIESYALSGLVIEKMWDDLRTREGTYSKDGTERVTLDDNFWKNFADRYIALEDPVKDRVWDAGVKLFSVPMETWSPEDALLAKYLYVQYLRKEAGLMAGRPSFADFFSIYTRLARVAHERFSMQFDHEPSREEYEHMLSHPSFQKMMEQMMMNSRSALNGAMAALERNDRPNPEDTSRKFQPDCFEIVESGMGPVLQPNEAVMDRVRDALKEFMEQYRAEGKKDPLLLRCPVIYTKKFKEMCDWMFHEFSYHYLDQEYPKAE